GQLPIIIFHYSLLIVQSTMRSYPSRTTLTSMVARNIPLPNFRTSTSVYGWPLAMPTKSFTFCKLSAAPRLIIIRCKRTDTVTARA
ncbi:hypothetical protein A2U01_0061064, partial [Trifolium medium]|nr:hypothetical protein [Trifolium medium]